MLFYFHAFFLFTFHGFLSSFALFFAGGRLNLYDVNILSTNASFIYLLLYHSNADGSSGFYDKTFLQIYIYETKYALVSL